MWISGEYFLSLNSVLLQVNFFTLAGGNKFDTESKSSSLILHSAVVLYTGRWVRSYRQWQVFALYLYFEQVSHLISSRFSLLFRVLLVGWRIGGRSVISNSDRNNQMTFVIDDVTRWGSKDLETASGTHQTI